LGRADRGLSVACSDPDRVSGLILGNTWFWPPDRRARIFSLVMSSPPMQRAILKRNMFVERILPSGISRKLSTEEMEHYRAVQSRPEDRVGVAELPKQIVKAKPFLGALEQDVRGKLAGKRTLITFPMRDRAFAAKTVVPRMREAFLNVQVTELPTAKHFFVEDAPHDVAAAIRDRFE